jgi:hypothetical protein
VPRQGLQETEFDGGEIEPLLSDMGDPFEEVDPKRSDGNHGLLL